MPLALDELRKAADSGSLTPAVAAKYLTTYLGPADWDEHIGVLYQRLSRKTNEVEAKATLRKAVAFAILFPTTDKGFKIDSDHPEKLLFQGMAFQQFNSRNWVDDLQKTIKRDVNIEDWRRQALELGVIDPIEYHPFCRQAYNWVYGKAQETGAVTEETKQELARRFRNLVLAYGGAVISYLFTNHQNAVAKVLNWRSGYFIERAIFEAYSLDQVLKIKRAELERTNEKLKKTLKVG